MAYVYLIIPHFIKKVEDKETKELKKITKYDKDTVINFVIDFVDAEENTTANAEEKDYLKKNKFKENLDNYIF